MVSSSLVGVAGTVKFLNSFLNHKPRQHDADIFLKSVLLYESLVRRLDVDQRMLFVACRWWSYGEKE